VLVDCETPIVKDRDTIVVRASPELDYFDGE